MNASDWLVPNATPYTLLNLLCRSKKSAFKTFVNAFFYLIFSQLHGRSATKENF